MTREYSIDILRIISAIAVVVIHVVTSPVVNSTTEIDINLATNLELIHTLLNWSVPVFFMITGYCLLKKQECTYEYCFSHVKKYIGVLFTVGLFYTLLEEIYLVRTFNASVITKSVLNVINGNLWDHMWYIYSLIGIYLVMPIIHGFMQQGTKNILILTSLLFFFNILCPTIQEWLYVGIHFPFGNYLFYVCFGGTIAKCKTNKTFMYLCYLMGIFSIIWIFRDFDSFVFGYEHLAVCLVSMSIFLFISKMKFKPSKLILTISECTWGIYLIHAFFINVVIKALKIDLLTFMPYMKLFMFAIMLVLLSFITTYILRKIPFIKRLF